MSTTGAPNEPDTKLVPNNQSTNADTTHVPNNLPAANATTTDQPLPTDTNATALNHSTTPKLESSNVQFNLPPAQNAHQEAPTNATTNSQPTASNAQTTTTSKPAEEKGKGSDSEDEDDGAEEVNYN